MKFSLTTKILTAVAVIMLLTAIGVWGFTNTPWVGLVLIGGGIFAALGAFASFEEDAKKHGMHV